METCSSAAASPSRRVRGTTGTSAPAAEDKRGVSSKIFHFSYGSEQVLVQGAGQGSILVQMTFSIREIIHVWSERNDARTGVDILRGILQEWRGFPSV